MSNRRKLDLVKLARVLARDMTRPATTTPNVAVNPDVAALLQARGWERDREFKVIEPGGSDDA